MAIGQLRSKNWYAKWLMDIDVVKTEANYIWQMLESNAMRRLSLNGTHLSFSEEELKKLMKTNEKITRKEISEHFGVSLNNHPKEYEPG